jgi:transmembrane sensor
MDKKELLELVRKYLDGKASPEEKAFVEAWYREKDSDRSLESVLASSEIRQMEAELFRNIQSGIRVNTVPEAPVRSLPETEVVRLAPGLPRRRRIRFLAAAASLIFIIAGSYILFQRLSRDGSPGFSTFSSQPGKVSKLVLADGSQVWLNADSRLKFADNFGKPGPREIFLDGEAYFEVAKDELHPFLVHAQGLTTHVLGTKFNVRAYGGLSSIEVTLLEGKVMLSARGVNKEDTLYLAPNQKALFTRTDLHRIDESPAIAAAKGARAADSASKIIPSTGAATSLTRAAADHADESAAWRNGKLIFRDMPLGDVITSLGHKYNIHIHSDSSLLNSPVNAIVQNNLSPEEALLEITRQLKRVNTRGQARSGDQVQFRMEDSVYYIE